MPSDEKNATSGQSGAAETATSQAQPELKMKTFTAVQPATAGASSAADGKDKPKENVLLGTVGAVLGSLVGVVAIILLDRLGFVAAISGVVMAAGTILLYEKFAKGLSGKGIAICIVVMILMTLLAENIAVSISVVQEAAEDYGVTLTFGEVFGNLYELIAEDVIDGGVYAGSLALVYLFNALGAFGIIKSSFDKRKNNK